MRRLLYKDLGRMEYLAALALQEKVVALKQRNGLRDVLLLVEHPHVYTLGRGGHATNVREPADVPVYRTSRGGDVTYHGPGQLVAYPLIDLRSKLRKAVHDYLARLELTVILTLRDYGLHGTRRPPYTGIWIGDKKIAAIGVAVSRGISYHGLALNVNTDLSYFGRIVPCGLTWAEVTSMANELGKEQDQERVKDTFLQQFARLFDYSELQESLEIGNGEAVQKGCSYEGPTSGVQNCFGPRVSDSGFNPKL